MSDPLSITAGIVGILTAAAQISSLLLRFTDAPVQAQHVLTEVKTVSGILSQLQSFLLGKDFVDRSRISLLQVDQVVTVLSGCVMTFSELEKLLSKLKVDGMDVLDRVRWLAKEGDIKDLVQSLQNHKASLSLMLEVFNGYTIHEAKNSVDRLYNLVDSHYQAMSSRLLALELEEQQRIDYVPPVLGMEKVDQPTLDSTLADQDICRKDTGRVAAVKEDSQIPTLTDKRQDSQVYRRALGKQDSTLMTFSWKSSESLEYIGEHWENGILPFLLINAP